ncbi:MAG: glycosyltransferase family 2 protein, partial [Candidatus Micrarchaeota archaeon]
MPNPNASIIILNYNGKHYLEDCLGSIAKLPKEPSFETILVDNASTDGSVEFVKKRFPWARLVQSKENLGFAGGNNLGAKEAKGEFLVFLNYDTIVEKGWLAPLLAAFKEPKVAAAQSKVLFENDRSRINTLGTDTHITGLTVCKHIFKEDKGFEKTEEVSGFSGCSVMVPKKIFKELGGFDHDFFLYLEDTDIGWRARLAGYKILAVPASRVYHKYKLKMNPAIFRHNERNRLLMVLK